MNIITKKELELIEKDLCYDCGPENLRWVTRTEHMKIHRKGESHSDETKRKMLNKKTIKRTDEEKANLSAIMKKKWADPKKREEMLNAIRLAGKNRRIHNIDVRQNEEPTTYSREYQRKFREANPNYYRDLQRARKSKAMEAKNDNE